MKKFKLHWAFNPRRAGRKHRARKRYAPEGWPHGPLWSDDDIAAGFARRRRHTGTNGQVLKTCKDKTCSCHTGYRLQPWQVRAQARAKGYRT